MLLDFVDSLTHSSYIAHSSADAAGTLDDPSFMAVPVPLLETEGFELNSGASGIVLKPSLPDS
jgi:hypothetical protein